MKILKSKVTSMLLITALGTSLVAGGSAALFTAQASNTNNTFAAGTVSINAGIAPVFSTTDVVFNNMAPGDAGIKTISVTNTGSLDAWVRVKHISTSGVLFSGATPLTLNNFEVFQIPAGQSKNYTINYDFKKAADNSYQGANGIANIEFEAVQVKNNPNPWTIAKTVPGGSNITAGTINVTSSSQNLVLDVTGLWTPEVTANYPDLEIIGPSGQTYGYSGGILNGSGSQTIASTPDSGQASYTGWVTNPEQMVFENPAVGTWTIKLHNSVAQNTTAIVSSNQQIQ
ncbi:SipW-cognate class signal peptide [Paenibacillus sp. yr247]|uniref:TasA family protein n=1 Tax=Paenibacillus sp. yr247 TaxID=1761880 RepID=UPI000888A898|nr:TasA family protein [Paenibacillus sp. yr247]SDO66245.1 SipW-cognate class signal peptide [Paenibacillus sp. yr247]